MTPEERLAEMGITLPEVPVPVANYVPFRFAGSLLFLSGQVPRGSDGKPITGRLGVDTTIEQGYEYARICALQLVAVAKTAVGDLSRLSMIKLLGMVNAAPDFTDHPKVVNGASDLFVELFGEEGRHARSAVGMGSLPSRVTVEVEAIFHVR
ncbi:RidA family protein [Mesorhizobium sp. M1340]|uniref:RidA family protein n=1 Tax=Mesorhizobium sp. M1340 TaxID=2957087 RepID=UPI003339B2E9